MHTLPQAQGLEEHTWAGFQVTFSGTNKLRIHPLRRMACTLPGALGPYSKRAQQPGPGSPWLSLVPLHILMSPLWCQGHPVPHSTVTSVGGQWSTMDLAAADWKMTQSKAAGSSDKIWDAWLSLNFTQTVDNLGYKSILCNVWGICILQSYSLFI